MLLLICSLHLLETTRTNTFVLKWLFGYYQSHENDIKFDDEKNLLV